MKEQRMKIAMMGSVGVPGPGVIHQTGTMQRIVVGEYGGTRSGRVEELHAALARSGVTAELVARKSP